MKLRKTGAFVAVFIILIVIIVFALTHGQYKIELETLWEVIKLKFTGAPIPEELETPSTVLWSVRLPRTLMAILGGAALGSSGVVFQGIMRNPLISPSFLGITHGAVFGASLAIIFFSKSALGIEVSAFVWALIVVALVYVIGDRGINSVTTLVIAGVIVSLFFTAASSFLKYIADPYEELPAITFWTMGGLNAIMWSNVARASVIITVGITIMYLFRSRLNLIAVGDEEAMSMGLNTKMVRRIFMLSGTLVVATTSASCGIIMWVDLVVTHISRLLIGPDHTTLVPFAAITGAAFLLLTDTCVRLFPGGEMPISIVTSLLGAPLLAYLLVKQQNTGWKAQ